MSSDGDGTVRRADRRAPCLVAVVMTLGLVLPFVWASSHHPDEDQYAWSAAYFGKKVLALDFARSGTDVYRDPGWDPGSYWGRSMGTRAVYSLALATPLAHAPALPYSWDYVGFQGPEARLDRDSLIVLRILAAACAVLGAALLAWRFGWVGAGAISFVLLLPHNAENFARAWAEGPLLLAFGLVAAAYGSRLFPLLLGAASTVKFTAVGLWPLALLRSAHGWRSRALALVATVATWTLLTPPSWFDGGPLHGFTLFSARISEYGGGQASEAGDVFAPSRYFWPFELGVALLVVWLVARRVDVRSAAARVARRKTPSASIGGAR